MTSATQSFDIQKYIPVIGDLNSKSPLAYKLTRGAVAVLNVIQMAIAEAYINGLEVPDSVLQGLVNACMPILFKYCPSLLAPYEWVLKETDHVAEGSRDLMKVHYDLPQSMLNTMIAEEKLIYPKYTMALWENGTSTLAQAQMHMLDAIIAKLH